MPVQYITWNFAQNGRQHGCSLLTDAQCLYQKPNVELRIKQVSVAI